MTREVFNEKIRNLKLSPYSVKREGMDDKIKWSYAGDPVSSLEECMALIKVSEKDDGFLLGERPDAWMQASGYGEGPYYCEVGFDFNSEEGTTWYAYPEEVSWDGLVDLSRRFEGGEDFSYAKEQWVCSVNAAQEQGIAKRLFLLISIICFIGVVVAFSYFDMWSLFSRLFLR